MNIMFDSYPVLLTAELEAKSCRHDQVLSKDGGDTSAPTAVSQKRRRDDLAIFDEPESSGGPLSGLMTSSNTLKIGNDLKMSGCGILPSRPLSNTGPQKYFRRSHYTNIQRPQTAKMRIETKA